MNQKKSLPPPVPPCARVKRLTFLMELEIEMEAELLPWPKAKSDGEPSLTSSSDPPASPG